MKITTLIICLILSNLIYSQKNKLPILKANAPVLSIKEGKFFHKNIWTVDPSIEIDEYIPHPFKLKTKLYFFSDIDTLFIEIKPNKKYDFIVRLPNGEEAFTRINTDLDKDPTLRKKMEFKHTTVTNATIDSIPFTLGNDNRIYVKGRINNSETLNFLFDTGASAIVLTSSAGKNKVKLKLDGQVENEGGDGFNTVETSSKNELTIGNLIWKEVNLLSIDYQKPSFDGVLGWVAFEGKFVEINYDLNYLIIHSTLKEIPAGYSQLETTMLRDVPYIRGSFFVNNIESNGWLLYDTGYDGTIFLSQKFASENDLNNKMEINGTSYSSGSAGVKWKRNDYTVPTFKLAEFEMQKIPLAIAEKDPEGVNFNDILGNGLLKNFNAILDLQNYIVYLKPNRMTK